MALDDLVQLAHLAVHLEDGFLGERAAADHDLRLAALLGRRHRLAEAGEVEPVPPVDLVGLGVGNPDALRRGAQLVDEALDLGGVDLQAPHGLEQILAGRFVLARGALALLEREALVAQLLVQALHPPRQLFDDLELGGDLLLVRRLELLELLGLLGVERHELAHADLVGVEPPAPGHDLGEHAGQLGDDVENGLAPLLDAFGDLDLALAGEQRHGAHLAQVHAHRVVGLADGPGRQVQLRTLVLGGGLVLLAAQAQAPEVRGLGGVDQLDVLLAEHDDDVVDLVAVDHLRRQHVVDLVIGQEPLLLADVDQLLDLVRPFFLLHPVILSVKARDLAARPWCVMYDQAVPAGRACRPCLMARSFLTVSCSPAASALRIFSWISRLSRSIRRRRMRVEALGGGAARLVLLGERPGVRGPRRDQPPEPLVLELQPPGETVRPAPVEQRESRPRDGAAVLVLDLLEGHAPAQLGRQRRVRQQRLDELHLFGARPLRRRGPGRRGGGTRAGARVTPAPEAPHLGPEDLLLDAEALRRPGEVVGLRHAVANLREQGHRLADGRHLPLDGVEAVLLDRAAQKEVHEILGLLDEPAKSRRPLRADEAVGVGAVGQQHPAREQPVGDENLEAALGRADARGVPVEDHHPAFGEPAHQRRVPVRERGAGGRDHVRHAGLDGGDQVEVALDDDADALAADRILGPVQPVQDIALVIQRRLRRIEVFRFALRKQAPAESHHPAGDIVDREDHPPAEAVDDPAGLALGRQAGLEQLLLREALLRQFAEEHVAARNRPADAELLAGGGGDRTALEVGEGLAAGGAEEIRLEDPRGGGVGLEQALLETLFLGPAGRVLGEGYPPARGEKPHGFGKTQTLSFHNETNHIAALATAKTVKDLPLLIHREGRRFFAVKRTETHVVAAALLQGDVVGNDVVNGVRTPDLLE